MISFKCNFHETPGAMKSCLCIHAINWSLVHLYCLHSMTAGRDSSWLLQLIFMYLFPYYSALAAAETACVNVWCTAQRLIAATLPWGQTVQRPALWSPAPDGRPRTGTGSVTYHVITFPERTHSLFVHPDNKIQITTVLVPCDLRRGFSATWSKLCWWAGFGCDAKQPLREDFQTRNTQEVQYAGMQDQNRYWRRCHTFR